MIAAVIPMKRLADAKSRLAPHLAAAQRIELARRLLARTVEAVRACGLVGRIALVSPEPGLAGRLGIESLADQGSLNTSLAEGVRWATAIGAARLLILPADLASIEAEDVRALVEADSSDPGVVICRTADGGTGALLLTPPAVIPPAFGPESFQQHLDLACDRNVSLRVVTRLGLSLDVDTVEDLAALER